jgi:thiol-disulfide isomerase/thioredoxin
MRTFLSCSLAVLLFASCADDRPIAHDRTPRTGAWRMELDVRTGGDGAPVILPFLFDLAADSGKWTLRVHNGEETIVVDDLTITADTFHVRMPLFDSEFTGVPSSDSVITGYWHNHLKGPDYRIPFTARAGITQRFAQRPSAGHDLTGNWECHFADGTPDAYPALGIFKSTDGRVTGTFGTETGDYRFLDGVMHGDSLLLSAFDGSHAFLFNAALRGDTLVGRFRSGIHSQEPWFAVRNEAFRLRDPDSLTFLKEGYGMVDFRLPDVNGDSISPMDRRFAGHVRMVQVMGSWCPNCVDETVLLNEMYDQYHDQGLDVIAIAFERYPEKSKAISSLKRFKDRLSVKYDVLYGGESRKEVASEKLPFLDHIMSYPTCIFIDRAGKVRRIRTGFYGPGTGSHYENYKRNLKAFIEQMLAEPAVGKKAA